MRFSAFIIACAASELAFASVVFDRAREFPDLGLELPVLSNARGMPLEMPRASAYLVGSGEDYRLVDRFDTLDLWTALTVRGRWIDGSGNRLWVARIPFKVPADQPDTVRSRVDFRSRLERLVAKDRAGRDEAVMSVAPVDVREPEKPRRANRQNFTELWEFPCDDPRTVVYAFLPKIEGSSSPLADWYMVAFAVAPSEDLAAALAAFDKNFLDEVVAMKPVATAAKRKGKSDAAAESAEEENRLLREDVRRAVVNYPEWHCTDSGDVVVVDNLPGELSATFASALTNRLPVLRRSYATVAPSLLKDALRPAVVRVFESREQYLAYVGVDYQWTAAVWSPERRELAAYLPAAGLDGLMETIRHEAFHQYLAYAGAMITASPWFNEGHAELFSNTHFDLDGNVVFDADPAAGALVRSMAADFAELLPSVLRMDYPEFYGGDAAEREAKYALAWSVAYFLQKGAPEIRFQPFRNLRSDYMKALVRTRDFREATQAVLPDEQMKLLSAEWLKFWSKDQ